MAGGFQRTMFPKLVKLLAQYPGNLERKSYVFRVIRLIGLGAGRTPSFAEIFLKCGAFRVNALRHGLVCRLPSNGHMVLKYYTNRVS